MNGEKFIGIKIYLVIIGNVHRRHVLLYQCLNDFFRNFHIHASGMKRSVAVINGLNVNIDILFSQEQFHDFQIGRFNSYLKFLEILLKLAFKEVFNGFYLQLCAEMLFPECLFD